MIRAPARRTLWSSTRPRLLLRIRRTEMARIGCPQSTPDARLRASAWGSSTNLTIRFRPVRAPRSWRHGSDEPVTHAVVGQVRTAFVRERCLRRIGLPGQVRDTIRPQRQSPPDVLAAAAHVPAIDESVTAGGDL